MNYQTIKKLILMPLENLVEKVFMLNVCICFTLNIIYTFIFYNSSFIICKRKVYIEGEDKR